MGLSATLNIAQSALATNAALSSLVSRNIAGVNDPSYSRKIANLATLNNGTGSLVSVSPRHRYGAVRQPAVADVGLGRRVPLSRDGLDQLEQTVSLASTHQHDSTTSTTTAGNSPAVLIGKLDDALQQYAATPSDATTGQAVVTAAKTLASALNAASTTVQSVRAQADKDIASAVADVNSLLGQFKTVNDAIVKGTASRQRHDRPAGPAGQAAGLAVERPRDQHDRHRPTAACRSTPTAA